MWFIVAVNLLLLLLLYYFRKVSTIIIYFVFYILGLTQIDCILLEFGKSLRSILFTSRKPAVKLCYLDGWCFCYQNSANFRHVILAVFSFRTYFRHQWNYIFPTVLHYWEMNKAELVEKLKKVKNVVWTDDEWFDSMSRSENNGANSMFCTTIMKISHFDIVQVWYHNTLIFSSVLCSFSLNAVNNILYFFFDHTDVGECLIPASGVLQVPYVNNLWLYVVLL